MDNYHVTKSDDHWQLLKEGNSRAYLTGTSKTEIMDKVHTFMQFKIGSVKIHSEDGALQEERTYPRKEDPKKSKG